ncbi:MAG: peptide MFS transporter [Bacteroidia bacterium]|nr:peptide MFS transporter [Bacteroidia bacterium]MDW8089073.1 peptide MFS transporter [Bacteroidia bacterium]
MAKPLLGQHPPGLYVLFFSEMWERFSYYGMRAILVLYLTLYLPYTRQAALEIYGLYTGLVYLTPLLGGFLADRWLGYRGTVLAGAFLMMVGHFAMAFPTLLFPALALLILGNGLFKPNISTIVGSLYLLGDPRRDAAFTIFYMGINLGAFFSPLVCGTLADKFTPHWGFGAAGVGMLISLIIFLGGLRTLRPAVGSWQPLSRSEIGRIALVTVLGIGLAFSGGLLAPVIGRSFLSLMYKWLVLSALAATLLYLGLRLHSRAEWQRTAAILLLAGFTAIFWMGFEQAGGTLNLFAQEKTQRTFRLAGQQWEFPAPYFQSLNPLLIFILAPLFSLLWVRLAAQGREPSTPAKMGLGLLLLSAGFLMMSVAEWRAQIAKVSPFWLVGVYLLHTLGELCLSPVGLSMVTRVAPPTVAALMMGVWFLASSFGNYMAGVSEEILQRQALPLYPTLMGISGAAGLLLLLGARRIDRWMRAPLPSPELTAHQKE